MTYFNNSKFTSFTSSLLKLINKYNIRTCIDNDGNFFLSRYSYQYDTVSTDIFFKELIKKFNLGNTDFKIRASDDYKSIFNLSFKFYYELENQEDRDLFFKSWLCFLGPAKHAHYLLGLHNSYSINYKNHNDFMNFFSLDFSDYFQFNEKEFLNSITFKFSNPNLYDDFLKNFIIYFEKNYHIISNQFDNDNLKFKFEKKCFILIEEYIKQKDLHLFNKFFPSLSLKNSSNQLKAIEDNNLNLLVNIDINLLQHNYPDFINSVHLNDFLSQFSTILNNSSKFNFTSLIHNDLHIKSFLLLFKNKDNIISKEQLTDLINFYYINKNNLNIKNEISDYIDNIFLFNQLNKNSIIQKNSNTKMKI